MKFNCTEFRNSKDFTSVFPYVKLTNIMNTIRGTAETVLLDTNT